MPDDHPFTGGWYRPHGAHKVHFFRGNRQSLCEWHYLPAEIMPESLHRIFASRFVHPACQHCSKVWTATLERKRA